MPAVLLQGIVDGFWPVGVCGIHHPEREPAQITYCQDRRMLHQQLLGGLHSFWVQSGPGQVVHGPFHYGHFLCRNLAPTLQRGQPRPLRFQPFSEHRGARSDRGGGPDPGGRLTVRDLQHPHQELGHRGGAVGLR